MPLFYRDVAQPIALRERSEIDVCPRINGALQFSSDMLDVVGTKWVDEHKCRDCFDIFWQSVLDVHSSLVLALLMQNERMVNEFTYTQERENFEHFYLSLFLDWSGFIKEESEIDKVTGSGIFDCFIYLQQAPPPPSAYRVLKSDLYGRNFRKEQVLHYSNQKAKLVQSCSMCSGGPCVEYANRANGLENVEDNSSSCCLEDGYRRLARSFHHELDSNLNSRNLTGVLNGVNLYLFRKSLLDRHAIKVKALGLGSHSTVEAYPFQPTCPHSHKFEASEVKVVETKIPQLISEAKGWIKTMLPKLTPKRLPASVFPSGTLLASFVGLAGVSMFGKDM